MFLDESGVNINMTRHYARAQSNQRAVDTPLNTPVNTTILSSIRLDGTCVYTIYQGGTTAERFQQYLEANLLPTLGPGDIVIMDNMWSKIKAYMGNKKSVQQRFYQKPLRQHLRRSVSRIV